MKERFYIDTSIWIDVYEDRKGYNGELLGRCGSKLLFHIIATDSMIIITDYLIIELCNKYNIEQVKCMMMPFEKIIKRIDISSEQYREAEILAFERRVPYGDALHSIIARDSKCILIARDRHFDRLRDISEPHTPEYFI